MTRSTRRNSSNPKEEEGEEGSVSAAAKGADSEEDLKEEVEGSPPTKKLRRPSQETGIEDSPGEEAMETDVNTAKEEAVSDASQEMESKSALEPGSSPPLPNPTTNGANGDNRDNRDNKPNSPQDKEEEEEEEKEKKEESSSSASSSASSSPELQRLWKAVKEDPMDFSSWTSLLQYADASGELPQGREAYDAFLNRYPFCYGYWKKYADLEKRKGNSQRTLMVFERGIAAIGLSADLWIHYLNHVRTVYEEDFIRAQYERAIAACGREWRSDKLWDHYVKWEVGLSRLPHVLSLYDRILRNPTQGLAHQFEMFRDFVKEHRPREILGSEEFLSLRKEVLLALNGDESSSEEPPSEPPPESESTEEEDIAMKEKVIFNRKRAYKETEDFVQERWKFEDNIKRPYFHMKPLERAQLKNWSEYLDFEIQRVALKEASDESEEKSTEPKDVKTSSSTSPLVSNSRVEILFERCLIACALYEEFWFKYIDWLSKRKDGDFTDRIRDVYKRACEHHLREKVEIHTRRAVFEEKHGNLSLATEIFSQLESKYPEVVSFSLKRINIERRQGNEEQVRKLFESTIERKSGRIRTEIAVKYGRYLRLVLGDTEGALKVLEDAIPHDEKNPKIYLRLLDLHLHSSSPLDLSKVLSVLDTAMEKMGPKEALLFSQRKVELLEDLGSDIRDLEEAKEKHTQLQKELRPEGPHNSTAGESHIKEESNSALSSPTSTPATTNSASYNAHHSSQYQQYGARYSSNYNYNNGSNYGGTGNYYQAYSGSYAGY